MKNQGLHLKDNNKDIYHQEAKVNLLISIKTYKIRNSNNSNNSNNRIINLCS